MKILKYPIISLVINMAIFIVLYIESTLTLLPFLSLIMLSVAIHLLIYFQINNAYRQFGVINETVESILGGNLETRAISHNEQYDRELTANVNRLAKKLEKITTKKEEDEQTIKILTNNINSPIIYIDIDGRIRYVNHQFINNFHVSVEVNDIYEKLRLRKIYKFIDDAFYFELSETKNLQVEDRFYQANAIPIKSSQKFVGILFIFHDFTDIKKYEKLQREFLADANHELKTPISAIKGASEILLNGENHTKETIQEFLNIIRKENNRMERIVSDILLISRLESETLLLHSVKIDLRHLIQDVVSILNYQFDLKNQTLTVDLETDLFIEGDNERLKNAFINLINNSINYTNENKAIFISGVSKDNNVIIVIKDEGIGMEEKDIPHIFERFYRIDKARSRDTGGTGLGLAIVKSTLDMHKAKIEVKSQVEVGTEFTITFQKYNQH